MHSDRINLSQMARLGMLKPSGPTGSPARSDCERVFEAAHEPETPATAQAPVLIRSMPEVGPWLIWSNEHNAWWGPNGNGYTSLVAHAGRYAMDEAVRICSTPYAPLAWTLNCSTAVPYEVMVPSPEMLRSLALARANATIDADSDPVSDSPLDAVNTEQADRDADEAGEILDNEARAKAADRDEALREDAEERKQDR
jgi:hypothetical protein